MARRQNKQARILADAPTATNIHLADEADNAYAETVDAGHKVDPRIQKTFIAAVALLCIFAFGLVVPKDLFNQAMHYGGTNAGYSFAWFTEDLLGNVNSLVAVFTGNDNGPDPYSIRIIRYIVIAVTGAGLALCGAVYQGSFKNALVSPSTLGVMSGSTLGMMLWVVFLVDDEGSNVAWLDTYVGDADTLSYLWSNYSLAICSFVSCLFVVGVVLLVRRLGGKGGRSAIMLIICGQVIGSVMGAVSNSIRYYYVAENPYGVKASLLTDLQISSFYRSFTWIDLVAILIPLVAVFMLVMMLRRKMTLLSFTEGEARTMGVNSQRMQTAVVLLCTLLTAILISFCGVVGFVGFLVPHLSRRLVGPSLGYLLPCSLLVGACFVLGSYLLVEMTLGPAFETMVGMYISIGGAIVFLATALRGKGGTRGQFE
ncbi:MAG: iron ABC transporter permease [Coriobacteriia bacterium]|nr:iron ABC transporter permease [Coriobacteriia bacterium]